MHNYQYDIVVNAPPKKNWDRMCCLWGFPSRLVVAVPLLRSGGCTCSLGGGVYPICRE